MEHRTKMVLFSMSVLLIANFLGYVAASYLAESSLGQCFQNISGGYILFFDRSFVDCVRECKRRPRCQAIRYDRRTLICMLYPNKSTAQTSVSGCSQTFREEFKNCYELEGGCEEYHTKCNWNETCSLNATTLEPFCEILDCAKRPPFPQHADLVYYVDSKVGSVAKFQCKSYVEFSNGKGAVTCSALGKWEWCEHIQCAVPQDCLDLYKNYNISESGPHYISPDNRTVVRAFCDMETGGGGWTVIQRRNSSDVNFTRSWQEYKDGFGNASGNYWIGNDILHALTVSNTTLRVHLVNFNGSTYDARYSNFRVGKEASNYKMAYECFEGGNAGDALGAGIFSARNMLFSTIDKDNDNSHKSCSVEMKGGWWYNNCSFSNLNGVYCELGQNCTTWSTSIKDLFGHNETTISLRRTYSNPKCTTKTTTITPRAPSTHSPKLGPVS